jgi:hypothetical protein
MTAAPCEKAKTTTDRFFFPINFSDCNLSHSIGSEDVSTHLGSISRIHFLASHRPTRETLFLYLNPQSYKQHPRKRAIIGTFCRLRICSSPKATNRFQKEKPQI